MMKTNFVCSGVEMRCAIICFITYVLHWSYYSLHLQLERCVTKYKYFTLFGFQIVHSHLDRQYVTSVNNFERALFLFAHLHYFRDKHWRCKNTYLIQKSISWLFLPKLTYWNTLVIEFHLMG